MIHTTRLICLRLAFCLSSVFVIAAVQAADVAPRGKAALPPMTVTAMTPAPNTIQTTAISSILVTLSNALSTGTVNRNSIKLTSAGLDGLIDTADDVSIIPTAVSVVNGNQIKIDFPATTSILEKYRVTLRATASAPLAQTTFAANTRPVDIGIGDMDNDGKRDIVIGNNSGAPNPTIFLGDGTGNFGTKINVSNWPNPVYCVCVADFNLDGLLDVVQGSDGLSSNGPIILNTTTQPGNVTFATNVNFTMGSNDNCIRTADFNGDGLPDLVSSNQAAGTVGVRLNTTVAGSSTLSFSAHTPFSTGNTCRFVATGDINGDGSPDIVSCNYGSNSVSVLLNTTPLNGTTPTFATAVNLGTDTQPNSVELADINGDGKLDIIVPCFNSNRIDVFLNTTPVNGATATFGAKTAFTVSTNPSYVSVADIDGDGRPDIACANEGSNDIALLINTTVTGSMTPSFATVVKYPVGTRPVAVKIADLTGTGAVGMVSANYGANSVSVLYPYLFSIQDVSTGTLDGEFTGTFPSGNGTPGGDFSATFSVNTMPIVITSPLTASVPVNQPFTYTITATGFPAPTFTAAPLPDGMTFDGTTISGTSTVAAGTNVILTASNGVYPDVQKTLVISVTQAPVITHASTATAYDGVPFNFPFQTTGFPVPTFTVTGLPEGLFLNGAGNAIVGTPNGTITLNVTITASNGIGADDQKVLILTVAPSAPKITSSLTATAMLGVPFTYTVTASGTAPVNFSAVPLPAGLQLIGSTITGTPTANAFGTTNVTLTAANVALPDDSKTLILSVVATNPVFPSTPTANPNPANVGASVQFVASATNTLPLSYAWNFGDGSQGSGAVVSHIFPHAGTYSVSVTASTTAPTSTTVSFNVSVNALVGGTNGAGSATLPGELDSDGDGYSDIIETAAGTNVNSSLSAPGGKTVAPSAVQILKPVLKVNAKKLSLTLAGSLYIPADFTPLNKVVIADVAGTTRVLTLDAKGIAKSGADAFKMTVKSQKGVVSEQYAKFTLTLTGVPANLLNTSPVALVLDGAVYRN